MPQRTLIRGGAILSLDARIGDLAAGDLLIEDGKIAAIARQIPATDAEVIDASGMLVLPGFVDTHRHTWQCTVRHCGADWTLQDYFTEVFSRLGPRMRPEDVFAATLLGALGALDGGVTTLLDWSHVQNSPAHADAAVDALTDAGLRAVFAHGWPCNDAARWVQGSTLPHPRDLRRLRRERFTSDDGLVTLAMAVRGPESTTTEVTAGDFALARELGLRLTMHVFGESTSDGPANRTVEKLHDAGLLGPDLTCVHATGTSDAALRLMADHGVSASVAPQSELNMPGIGLPITDRLLAAGIRPSLSVDTETVTAADMFTQMRMALAAHRALRDDTARPAEPLPALSARDVLGFATVEGARATGLERRIGSLTPGKAADIVLLRMDDINLAPVSFPAAAVVLAAHPGNVDTVLVAGRVVKRGGRLVVADLDKVRRLAEASRDHLLAGGLASGPA